MTHVIVEGYGPMIRADDGALWRHGGDPRGWFRVAALDSIPSWIPDARVPPWIISEWSHDCSHFLPSCEKCGEHIDHICSPSLGAPEVCPICTYQINPDEWWNDEGVYVGPEEAE